MTDSVEGCASVAVSAFRRLSSVGFLCAGDRNSVGSVGSSRSTGSGQSSESSHNRQNEAQLTADACKVGEPRPAFSPSWNELTSSVG